MLTTTLQHSPKSLQTHLKAPHNNLRPTSSPQSLPTTSTSSPQSPQPLTLFQRLYHSASLTSLQPPQMPSAPWTLTTVSEGARGMKGMRARMFQSAIRSANVHWGFFQRRAARSSVSLNSHVRAESSARSGPESAQENPRPMLIAELSRGQAQRQLRPFSALEFGKVRRLLRVSSTHQCGWLRNAQRVV